MCGGPADPQTDSIAGCGGRLVCEFCDPDDDDPAQKSYSWMDMANLTHKTQVEIFNWCSCEDNEGKENPYPDCPKEETK